MSVDRRFLNWGIFFIALGMVPLLVQQGVVSRSLASDAWRLWPLVIVGIGIGLLLRRTPVEFAGGLVTAATFGIIFGGLLTVGPSLDLVGCGTGTNHGGATTAGHASGSFGAVATTRIQLNCGSLDVSTVGGSTWSVAATDPQGGEAVVSHEAGSLDVRAPSGGPGWLPGGWNRSWKVTLPADPMIDLAVQLDAGSGTIDLSGAHLSRLDVQLNAADARVDLSGASVPDLSVHINAASGRIVLPRTPTAGSIEVNAGSASICTTGSAALRLVVNGSLSSTDFGAAGLIQSGNTWTSPGFDTATDQIDLAVNANLGSVSLNPAGGCR